MLTFGNALLACDGGARPQGVPVPGLSPTWRFGNMDRGESTCPQPSPGRRPQSVQSVQCVQSVQGGTHWTHWVWARRRWPRPPWAGSPCPASSLRPAH